MSLRFEKSTETEYQKISKDDFTDAAKLDGLMVIHFDMLNHQDIPVTGAGLYYNEKNDPTPCWFLTWETSHKKIATGKISYTLYHLSESDTDKVYNEQKRFEKEIGDFHTYGRESGIVRSVDCNDGKFKPFRYDFKILDFQAKLMGNIDYDQIVNPLPTMSIPKKLSRDKIPDYRRKTPCGKKLNICYEHIAFGVTYEGEEMLVWNDCGRLECLGEIIDTIKENPDLTIEINIDGSNMDEHRLNLVADISEHTRLLRKFGNDSLEVIKQYATAANHIDVIKGINNLDNRE